MQTCLLELLHPITNTTGAEMAGLISTSNIHRVVRIEMRRIVHSDFITHEFSFMTADDVQIDVSAFAVGALEVVSLPDRVIAVERAAAAAYAKEGEPT